VKIQIEFNPAVVAEYRLIGYENRLLAREDFANDAVDAGEIGAGHSVTALYELALTGSPGQRIEPLRYGDTPTPPAPGKNEEFGWLKLRYKLPDESTSRLMEMPITRDLLQPDIARASADFRFAAAVAGFSQLLTGGRYTGTWSLADALALARDARGDDPFGYRGEFLGLVNLADSLSRKP